MTKHEIDALAQALDLLHDFISNGGASHEHYKILDEADSVFNKLKEEVTQ